MPFKFHSFLPDDDDELCRARPGSPPAFFSLPSPVSPRTRVNCLPCLTSGDAAAAPRQAFAPVPPTGGLLLKQQASRVNFIGTEAAAQEKDQKPLNLEALNCRDKEQAQEFTPENSTLDDVIRRLTDISSARQGKLTNLSESEIRQFYVTSREILLQELNMLELNTPTETSVEEMDDSNFKGSPYQRRRDLEAGASRSADDYDDSSGLFEIPSKNAPIDRLRRWRQAALSLNASRRFRYTLDLKKEEERQHLIKKIRAHAQAIRAAHLV